MTDTAAAITAFVAHEAIALVGASRVRTKFGNVAMRELRAKGYRIYPIHRDAQQIDGVKCYPGFADLPECVDAVLVVVPPFVALNVVRDVAAAGIRHVWLQQGAESPEVLALCDQLGLETVAGECILMFTKPTGVHRIHRWIRRACGTLPHDTSAI